MLQVPRCEKLHPRTPTPQRKDRTEKLGKHHHDLPEVRFIEIIMSCVPEILLEIAFLGTMDFFGVILIEVASRGVVNFSFGVKKNTSINVNINPSIHSSVQFSSVWFETRSTHPPVSASSSRRCSKVFANESVSSVLRNLRILEQRPTSTGMALAELLKGRHQRSVVKGIDLGFMMDSFCIQMDSLWTHHVLVSQT